MNKKLYADKGYLNFEYILQQSEKHNCPYIMIVGGRAVGKTYGILKYMLEHEHRFIFMRRTQTQLDMISRPELMPYTAINNDTGSDISTFKISKYVTGFYHSIVDEDEKLKAVGDPIAIGCALSTISNLRGFDASYYNDFLVFDEFIPERHERLIKDEASAFLNALETVARNRELQGKKPMTVLLLANANNISNPLFIELNLVNTADRMIRKGEEIRYIETKGIMLLMLKDSPISSAKANTSLYKLSQNTEFSDMALHNNFVALERDAVTSKDLKEYRLITLVGELAIYKHKSRVEFYVTTHISGVPTSIYEATTNQLRKFRLEKRDIWVHYCVGRVKFESYTMQVLFEKYFGN